MAPFVFRMGIGSGTNLKPAAFLRRSRYAATIRSLPPYLIGSMPPKRVGWSAYAAVFHDSSPQKDVMRSASSFATPAGSDQSAFLFISMIGKFRKISIDLILPA